MVQKDRDVPKFMDNITTIGGVRGVKGLLGLSPLGLISCLLRG